jgi:hypothetical protein
VMAADAQRNQAKRNEQVGFPFHFPARRQQCDIRIPSNFRPSADRSSKSQIAASRASRSGPTRRSARLSVRARDTFIVGPAGGDRCSAKLPPQTRPEGTKFPLHFDDHRPVRSNRKG